VGTLFMPGPKHLRLDIGYRWNVTSIALGDSTIAPLIIDSDFFTLTQLRSEGNLKFPVETVDYWFGLGAHWKHNEWEMRLRLAHVSTHLVDGLANADGTFEQQKPFVYSREFVELMAGPRWGIVRPYVGLTYVWSTQPVNVGRLIPQVGCDLRLPTPYGQIVAGIDARRTVFNEVASVASVLQAGFNLGGGQGASTSISIMRYDGRSVHGMFANRFDHYWALAIQVTPP
jgi:hypothetical protein